jgi:HAMP domain-containing protein
MKLRNQIILAFFLFSVVPLTGVTLYSYYSSSRAFRQAVQEQSVVRARDMDRRMAEVTEDLQHRIDRVSGLPDWAALAPGSAQSTDEWNALAARLQQDLGSAAGLVEQIEFLPAEPLVLENAGGGNAEVPVADSLDRAPKVLIHLTDPTELPEKYVVERVGDQVVVHRQSLEMEMEGEAPLVQDGLEIPPAEIPTEPETGIPSRMEELKGGLLALSRELENRDQQRRAGIDVPVAGPGEFEILLASEIGSAVLSDGRALGRVRARVSNRELLRRVLSRTKEGSGEIPFAVDAEGNLYTPDPADLSKLEPLGLAERVASGSAPSADDTDPNWVTVLETDRDSGLTFGIASPVGDSLDRMRTAAATNLAIGLGLVGLALGGILPLSTRMTRKLGHLTKGVEQLAGGDLEAQVPLRGRDEFGQLAGTFNRMARQLGEHQRRLVVQERLRRELELCRQIQDELLPRGTYRSPHAHVRGISIPAKELGGDFFSRWRAASSASWWATCPARVLAPPC